MITNAIYSHVNILFSINHNFVSLPFSACECMNVWVLCVQDKWSRPPHTHTSQHCSLFFFLFRLCLRVDTLDAMLKGYFRRCYISHACTDDAYHTSARSNIAIRAYYVRHIHALPGDLFCLVPSPGCYCKAKTYH